MKTEPQFPKAEPKFRAADEASRRAAIGAAGLGATLLASMLFRAVIAAQLPHAGAIVAQPVPPAPAVMAGRSAQSEGTR
ncbi:hypothetical protein HNP52_000314 [Sphingomonas kyeonggiensis]|uniref:Uncharacterized protein n=1 Tax=Sphingomonas kyeonggiensis TaxID=1268553 RepID=A0A7W7JXQ2_9SPHN|nr:hypothetical protein [Sphingomonas kyeonggiensis]MBB4837263.1 hypothetical protein [Sphingomonas kyeonggiensis]